MVRFSDFSEKKKKERCFFISGRRFVRAPELVQIESAGVNKVWLRSAEQLTKIRTNQHVCASHLRTLPVLRVGATARTHGLLQREP